MIIVKVTYVVKNGMRKELLKTIQERRITEKFSTQPGNLVFEFSLPCDNTDELGLIDIWENKETFEAHLSCDVNMEWAELRDKYITASSRILLIGEQDDEYDRYIAEMIFQKTKRG